jgi:hypothetical protein
MAPLGSLAAAACCVFMARAISDSTSDSLAAPVICSRCQRPSFVRLNTISCGMPLPRISCFAVAASASASTCVKVTGRSAPRRARAGMTRCFIVRQPGHQSAPTSTSSGRCLACASCSAALNADGPAADATGCERVRLAIPKTRNRSDQLDIRSRILEHFDDSARAAV